MLPVWEFLLDPKPAATGGKSASNVLGVDPADPTQRIIYGSLTTLVAGSKARIGQSNPSGQ
jgi:hypothetical protein